MRARLKDGLVDRSRDKDALVRISAVFGLCSIMVEISLLFFIQ